MFRVGFSDQRTRNSQTFVLRASLSDRRIARMERSLSRHHSATRDVRKQYVKSIFRAVTDEEA